MKDSALLTGRHTPPGPAADQRLEVPIWRLVLALAWPALLQNWLIVTVSLSDGGLNISISPSISVYSHHEHKRIAASICFEIAAKYAEKVGGEVIQRGAVAGCRPIGQSGDLLLARYPVEPLDWEHVCGGFRAVLLGPEPSADGGLVQRLGEAQRLDGAA